MKNLFFTLAFMLICSFAFANSNVLSEHILLSCNQHVDQQGVTTVEVTFTVILPSGKKEEIHGNINSQELSALDGQTFVAPGKTTNRWVHIPVYYVGSNGDSGLINWYGPGDEPFWGGSLHQFLLELLRNL